MLVIVNLNTYYFSNFNKIDGKFSKRGRIGNKFWQKLIPWEHVIVLVNYLLLDSAGTVYQKRWKNNQYLIQIQSQSRNYLKDHCKGT